tara:strand:+ start:422 stop:703 length:282 start_codon:yes stop_codon:yes gene_type:complete
MAYNYKDKVIENTNNSYQEKFLEYATNWEDDEEFEKKRVKIITYNTEIDKNITFEDKINRFIEENKKNFIINDIKYTKNSVLIIYQNKDINLI